MNTTLYDFFFGENKGTKDGFRKDDLLTRWILFPSVFYYVKKSKRFAILYSNQKFEIDKKSNLKRNLVNYRFQKSSADQ